MGAQYYYAGADAARIRAFTRDKVLETIEEIFDGSDYEIGEDDGQLPLYKSGCAAEARYQRSEPFLLLAQRPTKSERCKVLGHDDDLAHSARKLNWAFLLQASAGKHDGETTDEQMKIADDELMDVLRHGFEERFAYFRDTLNFKEMTITYSDDAREGGGLNPLTLTFYNYIRMGVDDYGYTAAL